MNFPETATVKASFCNFYQNFIIHTLRCDLLYIHDEHRLLTPMTTFPKGKKVILSRWIFNLCRFSCKLSLNEN